MKKYAVACLSSLLAFVCVSEMTKRAAAQGKTAAAPGRAAASPAGTPEIDKDKIRAHVKFLASDLLEGRGTGQRGGVHRDAICALRFEAGGRQRDIFPGCADGGSEDAPGDHLQVRRSEREILRGEKSVGVCGE